MPTQFCLEGGMVARIWEGRVSGATLGFSAVAEFRVTQYLVHVMYSWILSRYQRGQYP